ncbi:MAG TPA: DUF1508 domain-containing protein [Phycisphaerae bacterium]|nr:DUF1508 domain-containing protein [Phycisphaerae bacterium]
MRTPRFEVYRDAKGEWRWRLRAGNGRIVADSGESYRKRRAAWFATGWVAIHAPHAKTKVVST